MKSLTTSKFWKCYADLPPEVQKAARKQFIIWLKDSSHPSLQFKKVGRVWSARVNLEYRALCYPKDGDFYWFWIGHHSEYDKLLK